MLKDDAKIILITGIMASGKSTVAQLLAERLDNSVHLRGDVFRRMIVNNRKEVTPDAGDAVIEQLKLRYRLAAQSADLYYEAGYSVIVQDVVIGPMLNEFISYVRHRPLHVVVLCPDTEVVALREASRAKTGYGAWTVEALDHVLQAETPRLGLWLDSSSMTAGETVAEILSGLENESAIIA